MAEARPYRYFFGYFLDNGIDKVLGLKNVFFVSCF